MRPSASTTPVTGGGAHTDSRWANLSSRVDQHRRCSWRPKLVATAVCIAVVCIAWHVIRNRQAGAWNSNAIAAQFTDLTVQKTEKDVHLIFRYALTNSTNRDYRIPDPKFAVLKKNVPQGLQDVDTVVWDRQLLIPARHTVNTEFDVALDPAAYDADEPSQHQDLQAFSQKRLHEIQNLVFIDYANHYVINLPRGWD